MKYLSTRGQTEPVSFTAAVAMGLAPDGGLLLPEELPDLRPHLAAWESLSYVELSEAFFRLFATDLEPAVLADCVARSYARFDHAEIAPLRTLEDGLHVLELFHGPTLAFKDFALQLLGNLYEAQIRRTGQPINVLGATSGDTGAAAIHGLLGKEGVNIFILYPEGGVSPLQERQMTCTGADNVHALAIKGSFDDAQRTIKAVFGDLDFRRAHHLSAVNSINLARVLAQCVYYLYAWFRLPAAERESVEFVVPTGNFGNVLAGWMVAQMGVPMGGFCVATNQNDILYRLFETGVYEVGPVHPSYAPSMDIQVASNFERLLWFLEGRDPERVRAVMKAFAETGHYTFPSFDRGTFRASRVDDAGIERIIAEVYRKYDYIVDPHTACGFADLRRDRPTVVLSTAHPAKFPDTIERAIGREATHPSLDALKTKDIAMHRLAATEEAVKAFIAEALK
ncbi:MAG: threonine synthase [Opitutales bacterium]